MKVRPKSHQTYTTEEDFEDFINSLSLNPEDITFFHEERILPRNYNKRMEYSAEFNAYDELGDDLYDEQIAFDVRRLNRQRKFTEKIPLTEINKLSADEYLAYHSFLVDLKKEQKAESLS